MNAMSIFDAVCDGIPFSETERHYTMNTNGLIFGLPSHRSRYIYMWLSN